MKDANPRKGKYSKPRILLVDIPDAVAETLLNHGFNVTKGSLGTPYRVSRESVFRPLIGRADMPHYTEQEIVILDFRLPSIAPSPLGEKHRPEEEYDLWGKCDRGFLDGRVRS